LLSAKKQSIVKWIVFLPVLAVLLTFAIILTMVISIEQDDYKKSLEQARISYVKRSKIQAQERIDKLIDYINVNEQLLREEAEEEIANMVDLAHRIMVDIYNENPTLPREKIIQKIKDKLKDVRFFNDLSGYYALFDFEGKCVMHGLDESLEGKNMLNYQDRDGYFFIQEMIAHLKESASYAMTWRWKNPTDVTHRKKIGYAKRVEPLNLFIVSGRYEDTILDKIKKETQKVLLNTKYGEYGYIFAYDYAGNTISHGDHSLVGKNRLDVVSNHQFIIRDIVVGGKLNVEGFFMNYTASYHPIDNDRQKVSFIRPIPQFKWVVGTGTYLLEENNVFLEQEKMLKAKMQTTIANLVLISLVIMCLIMAMMFIISIKLRSLLDRYENHLLLNNKQMSHLQIQSPPSS
jgi:signal transduction histidine kinase